MQAKSSTRSQGLRTVAVSAGKPHSRTLGRSRAASRELRIPGLKEADLKKFKVAAQKERFLQKRKAEAISGFDQLIIQARQDDADGTTKAPPPTRNLFGCVTASPTGVVRTRFRTATPTPSPEVKTRSAGAGSSAADAALPKSSKRTRFVCTPSPPGPKTLGDGMSSGRGLRAWSPWM
jgi:hypothetical protein